MIINPPLVPATVLYMIEDHKQIGLAFFKEIKKSTSIKN